MPHAPRENPWRYPDSYMAYVDKFEAENYCRIGPLRDAKHARTIRAGLYRFKASVWAAAGRGDAAAMDLHNILMKLIFVYGRGSELWDRREPPRIDDALWYVELIPEPVGASLAAQQAKDAQ